MRVSIAVLCALVPLCVEAAPPAMSVIVDTLTVQSEAISKVSPDQVILSVTVQEENKDRKIAKQKHDEKLQKLLDLAQASDISKEHISTGYTSLQPQYDWNNGAQRFRNYIARTNIEFTLTDISHLGHFMEEIVNASAANIDNVAYGLQNEKAVQEDTLVKAMAHAYSKATRMAEAAHVAIEKPLVIEEGTADSQLSYPRPMRAMAAAIPMGGGAPPELPSGMIEIHETVTVTYQIKPQ